jgi:hypothetical protein
VRLLLQAGGIPIRGAREGVAQAPTELTQDDQKNIDYVTVCLPKLMSLGGFTREQCIQAYLACEKDAGAAANLLLDGNY